ncbi:hypothetical protein [Streptomyces sp. NPDC002994]|uniref:hypothetical protein n=1 Tax=Streptomyces sp. NPDC002994 TaxID=3154441 RepID=UPI0033A06FDC
MAKTESMHVRGEGGQVIKMDLPLAESVADRLTKGYLRRVNADGSPYVEADPSTASAEAGGSPARPGKNAPKGEWVGWAAAVHGLEPDVAEGMTKADLADLPEQPVAEDPDASPSPSRSPRPAADAPKSEWIAHVVAQGHMSAEDAGAYTKDDLIELVS